MPDLYVIRCWSPGLEGKRGRWVYWAGARSGPRRWVARRHARAYRADLLPRALRDRGKAVWRQAWGHGVADCRYVRHAANGRVLCAATVVRLGGGW